jgi:hypothetical protein
VIVVVAVGDASINQRGLSRGEIEAVQPAPSLAAAAAVVDERAAVRRPIRCLDGRRRTVQDLAMTRGDVQRLEHAPDEIAIGHEAFFGGTNDADVANDGALGDVCVV